MDRERNLLTVIIRTYKELWVFTETVDQCGKGRVTINPEVKGS